jgi:L-alanine-DL-glutamate epimerase-like enolase superfamily enzyme
MAAIPNGLIQEFPAKSAIPWRDSVLKDPLDITGSELLVRDRPGLGIEFDDEALRPHVIA